MRWLQWWQDLAARSDAQARDMQRLAAEIEEIRDDLCEVARRLNALPYGRNDDWLPSGCAAGD